VEEGKPVATVKDNDVVFFVNARSDRARQITKAFVQKNFEKENPGSFKRKRVPKNIRFVAMTDFGPDLSGVFTAFPSPDIVDCLPKVIGNSYRQLYISETEKYAHVTYFINGGFADPLNGEEREVVKSPNEYSYANCPEMNSQVLTKRVVDYLNKGVYNFICVNYPNADMVGHTGDFAATKKAVMAVDQGVKKIVDAALKLKGQVLIVADHGNAEVKINPTLVQVMTEHTTNPVPCIWVKAGSKKFKLRKGILADVAPTLLKMMKVAQPKEMTGKALF
jgi:2,3-bisphosphoglycerate-independent phosphoglycerate mutase